LLLKTTFNLIREISVPSSLLPRRARARRESYDATRNLCLVIVVKNFCVLCELCGKEKMKKDSQSQEPNIAALRSQRQPQTTNTIIDYRALSGLRVFYGLFTQGVALVWYVMPFQGR